MKAISKIPRGLWMVCVLQLMLSGSSRLSGQESRQSMVRRYSLQAQEALAARNADQAATALEALARLTPNDPQVQANLGSVYYMQSRYEQAVESFERALKLNPQIPDVRPLLGICYAELDRPEDAIPLLAPAFENPPNKEVGRLIGINLMRSYKSLNQNFKALEVSEELLSRYPNDPEILYRAGHLYGDRALEIMQQLVKVAPKSPWKRMALAEALEGEKRYDLAIIQYRKLIAIDPNMPDVHYRLGRALLLNSVDSREAQNAALSELRQALAANPRNAAAAYEIGQVYRRRGDVQQAAKYFSLALKISPYRQETQMALARALIALRKPGEALPHLRVAVRLDPEDSAAHFLLAKVYRSEGDSRDYDQEMALYRKYHVAAEH